MMRALLLGVVLLLAAGCQTTNETATGAVASSSLRPVKLDGTVDPRYSNFSPRVTGATNPNTGITFYNGDPNGYGSGGPDEIPNNANPIPNDPTLVYHLRRYIDSINWFHAYRVDPSPSPRAFASARRTHPHLTEQMRTTPLLSYLYWDSGQIIHDEITPPDRFGRDFTNRTPYLSQSVGKSINAYITAHAICAGYIESIDQPLSDWPLMRETAYGQLRLIDVMNMRAGDNPHVDDFDGLKASGRWYNVHSLRSFAENELAGTTPSNSRPYHYNGLATRMMANYTVFKAGDNYQRLIDRVFRDKAGVANTVYLHRSSRKRNADLPPSHGTHRYTVYATRYDYLRIAKAMLDDWNANTCEGRVLKQIHGQRQSKNIQNDNPRTGRAKGYAGQFHTDYTEMGGRAVMGMAGRGGQSILIDFDNSRIVAVNSIHTTYDWYNLVHQVIKNGRIADQE